MNDTRPCGNNEKWCESCVSKGKCNYTKEIEKGKNEFVVTKGMIKNLKMQVETKDGEVVECDIDESILSELKGEQNYEM